jgi:hypothetical protein
MKCKQCKTNDLPEKRIASRVLCDDCRRIRRMESQRQVYRNKKLKNAGLPAIRKPRLCSSCGKTLPDNGNNHKCEACKESSRLADIARRQVQNKKPESIGSPKPIGAAPQWPKAAYVNPSPICTGRGCVVVI